MYGNGTRHSRMTCSTSNPVRRPTLQFSFRLSPSPPVNLCTHRRRAALTLRPILSLCTARSINATVSSFSAAAVSSTRASQRLLIICISAEEHQHLTFIYNFGLTLQSHIFNISAKEMQVVILKSFLRHLIYIALRVFPWLIEHIHPDVAQKLVIFGEHSDDGNFKTRVRYGQECS